MLARFLTRLVWSGLTLLGIVILTFLLINVVPGDPARVIAGPKASAAVLRQVREKYQLDKPVLQRLASYLGQVARGDLGRSFVTDQPVAEAILTRLPATA